MGRAVSGKCMKTPHGAFEMRHFITPGFTAAGGQAVANASIKDMVFEILKGEGQFNPLAVAERVDTVVIDDRMFRQI